MHVAPTPERGHKRGDTHIKRLFMLRDRGDHPFIGIPQADGPLCFATKKEAKDRRDELNATRDDGPFTVSPGPDHHLFADALRTQQRRRRSLPNRARRTQANMGRPQPQKHAARIERIAPNFRKD